MSGCRHKATAFLRLPPVTRLAALAVHERAMVAPRERPLLRCGGTKPKGLAGEGGMRGSGSM